MIHLTLLSLTDIRFCYSTSVHVYMPTVWKVWKVPIELSWCDSWYFCDRATMASRQLKQGLSSFSILQTLLLPQGIPLSLSPCFAPILSLLHSPDDDLNSASRHPVIPLWKDPLASFHAEIKNVSPSLIHSFWHYIEQREIYCSVVAHRITACPCVLVMSLLCFMKGG